MRLKVPVRWAIREGMGIFAWPGTNRVGCPEIDADHQPMLELLDKLHDAMVTGRGDVAVMETLNALIAQETRHFACEEKLMQKHGCPGLTEHRLHHRHLLKELQALRRRVRAGHMPVAYDTMQTMRQWVRDHINGEDRAAADHIMGRRADKHTRGLLMAG